jgi:hypothetical protein
MRRRFVEISKRGIWSSQRVAQERPDARYALLAIDFLPVSVLRSAMLRLASGLASGAARCLPLCRHSISAASSALRQLSQVRSCAAADLQACRSPSSALRLESPCGIPSSRAMLWYADS